MGSVSEEIREYTQRAGKTYPFDEAHDENVPAQMWFQESDEGLILFIVFYSLACRWSRCLGCCLPSKMSSRPVSYKALMAQVDHVFADKTVIERRTSISKVILSNNGSVLDQVTFSSTALMYLLAQINRHLPKVAILSIETRPEYVELAELEFMARALAEGETPTQLEIAIGFEAFDDRVRNDVYHKGLDLATFEQLAGEVAPYGYRLKCYFMQKPVPGMSDDDAVADIQRGIDYLSRVAARHQISVNMHLCPTYVAIGTALEDAFHKGQYTPPRLQDVARAALHGRGKGISIFIATFDEGLAVDGGSFVRPGDAALVAQLEHFNRTQDFNVLEAICS